MGFAEEEVKKYIRNNYPMFHDIRLNQLLDFLPCLTQADREKIRCNTKNDGNVLSVSEFFEHLWCRKNWVTQLIDALKINKSDLAEVIEEVYRDAQLPSQRTQAVRSPPVAQCSRPPVSVPGDCSAPPSDDPPLSPPHDQPRPARGLFSTSSPQASLPDVVDFRSPVQETKFPSRSNETVSETEMIEDGPPGATAVRPSYVPNTPTNSRANGNNASGSSGGARVFFSNHGEEDISLEKPGALVSGVLSSPDGEYSGTSDMLCISSELSEDSDPLMLSGSNQVGRSEVSERSMLPGAKDDSLSHRNERHSDGGSIKTHVIQIKEPPSVNLSAAPEMTRLVLGNANQSLGDFSDFVAGDRPTKNASSLSVPTDGRRNSHQNKSVSDASWHMSESTLLAVGLTLTSLLAGAFVLYKQLKK